MYQAHVYLDVRILVSREEQAFLCTKNSSGDDAVKLAPEVAKSVGLLARVLNCRLEESPIVEHLTGIKELPVDKKVSGLSVKAASHGFLDIEFHRRKKTVHIDELRIEEDAGRLTRAGDKARMDYTYAGCPSLRIKTSADFELGEEAELFLNELRTLLQYLGIISDVPVDSLVRCNAYASLSKYPDLPDYFVKLRNLNSFNFVRKAINVELGRQEDILANRGTVASESRLWNERQNITECYQARRPDLLKFEPHKDAIQFVISDDLIKNLKEETVELPEERRTRLSKEYGLSRNRASFICDDKYRADYFEKAIKAGADPMTAAHWISSELIRIYDNSGLKLKQSSLTPEYFAFILKALKESLIHSGIAKQLIQTVLETGISPEILIKRDNLSQIATEDELLPIVHEIIAKNPDKIELLRDGEMSPLEFLTGQVMRKTGGLAVPQMVKALIKRELDIKIVFVISMGGVLCGYKNGGGSIEMDGPERLRALLGENSSEIRTKVVPVRHLMSEEIEPGDWASLISEIGTCIATGNASGIVIVHGTDTLPYTAPLLYWLFSDAPVPIVFAAASKTPDVCVAAKECLFNAVSLASKKEKGVYVLYDSELFSPLNLKYLTPRKNGFSNWNSNQKEFCAQGTISSLFSSMEEPDAFVMKQILYEAANRMLVCRAYPGLNYIHYLPLIEKGVDRIFLELYETGAGSMRGGDYSIKPLLQKGRKRGCKFYCTSQQESIIDFSEYTTSRRVWREGATPMGLLTTESAIALYFAASLVADTDKELDDLMESYAELY